MIGGELGSFMEHDEAVLFRLLTSLFGSESVIFGMSALAACGGDIPEDVAPGDLVPQVTGPDRETATAWAKSTKCLFTIIDDAHEPKLVVDFEEDPEQAIDLAALEAKTRLPFLLKASGVKYLLLPRRDFEEIVDPTTALTFTKYLHARLVEDCNIE